MFNPKSISLSLLFILIVAFFLPGCGDDEEPSSDSGVPGDDDDNDDADDDDVSDDDDNNDDDDTGSDKVKVYLDGDFLVIENRYVSLKYNLPKGTYNLFGEDDIEIVKNAYGEITSHVLVPAHRRKTTDMPLVDWEWGDQGNNLGAGMYITIHREGAKGGPDTAQTFTLLDGKSAVIFNLKVTNPNVDNMKIGSIYTLVAEPPFGYLNIGDNKELRTLTNGILNYLEFAVPIFPGTYPALSNWSALIYNMTTGKSFSVGALEFEVAEPLVFNGPSKTSISQRRLQVLCQYEPAKNLGADDFLLSETQVLDFGLDTPFEALELYADRIKAWNNIETWTERHPEIGIPAGWNSWSGSGSSGGYGADGINETVIIENMDFADAQLRRWGLNYFQIDDGWAPIVGDWWVNNIPSEFPDHGGKNGMEFLMDRAKAMGFQTGLWMAAFNADLDSQTYANHPEYFADYIFNGLGGLIQFDEAFLDLSKPVAQDYLEGLMDMLKDWGIQWLKLDFAYVAALTQNWHEPNLCRGEYYRNGVKLIRETLGEDIFFLNVAIVGWNIGLVDSIRLTLDTMPVWDGESPEDPIDNQGLKPMYRDSIRKYYLHNRVWINHPDLIFFRAHKDTQYDPLTYNESITFASSVALQGGLMKIGDIIVDLEPQWVDAYRRILPVVSRASRPVDLFQREFPEVITVDATDFDEPYYVAGLLNWGANKDLTTVPGTPIPDADRTISVDFDLAEIDPGKTYLAFEFWDQEYLGEASEGTFSMTVPARSPKIVALRVKLDRPQFLGTNRHVLGGAKIIRSIKWNSTTKTLTGVMEGSIGTLFSPFTHQLTFYIPSGYTYGDILFDAPSGFDIENITEDVDGQVVTINFDVIETTDNRAQNHPDISWELSFL